MLHTFQFFSKLTFAFPKFKVFPQGVKISVYYIADWNVFIKSHVVSVGPASSSITVIVFQESRRVSVHPPPPDKEAPFSSSAKFRNPLGPCKKESWLAFPCLQCRGRSLEGNNGWEKTLQDSGQPHSLVQQSLLRSVASHSQLLLMKVNVALNSPFKGAPGLCFLCCSRLT